MAGIFACPFAAVQTVENNRLLSRQPVVLQSLFAVSYQRNLKSFAGRVF